METCFSKAVLDQLKNLEESLWRAETRYSLDFQEKYFAEDFFEFGRSGRVYNRTQMILSKSEEIRAKLPLEAFKVHQINKTTALVTYISEVEYDEVLRANRSSLWSKTNDGWELRFHQGTPVFEE